LKRLTDCPKCNVGLRSTKKTQRIVAAEDMYPQQVVQMRYFFRCGAVVLHSNPDIVLFEIPCQPVKSREPRKIVSPKNSLSQMIIKFEQRLVTMDDARNDKKAKTRKPKKSASLLSPSQLIAEFKRRLAPLDDDA
jgi:hypothetical protein